MGTAVKIGSTGDIHQVSIIFEYLVFAILCDAVCEGI